ncbi:ABC transporter permease [Gracilibacillus alcaliphilus]|uniref:ABC transporter permease n=1 Tax=Gracilibacillus alcaliphilus TaxID=1401441 RepID=UPI0019598CAA|nr:ABC transporter permease [Gracilibacillus alcaliphilus]MBM7677815.1 putative ABC transport system permease protein [Gracilibacillus alcaliphilus]
MTLFDLAVKNIRRNMKNYGLYIGATVFSIIIYFTFATLKHSDDISVLAETSRQVKGIMSGSAFVLVIFVAIFILYSNTFFMKKRKQEVALYSLLGVRKRTIGFLLFFENMMIGLTSLLIGMVLGFFLSQLFLAILMKLMGLDMAFTFAFSGSAVIETVMVFFLIFLVTSLLGYRVIYQFKLIDLFHAAKKGEDQPKARLIAALIGVLTLVLAYWLALQDLMTSAAWRIFGLAMPLIIIGLTILGSYLLFNSVLVYVLNTLKKRAGWAWKGLNLMTASQLLYRIRANAKTLTIIATLSATTITAGGAVFGMYYNTDQNVEEYIPFSFMWKGPQYEIEADAVEATLDFEVKDIRVSDNDMDREYYVIDQSTFTKLAETLNWNDIESLSDKANEVLLIDPFYDERWSEPIDEIVIEGTAFPISKTYAKSIFNAETLPGAVLVIEDETYQGLTGETASYHAVQMDDYKKHAALSEQLAKTDSLENFSSAVANYQDLLRSSGAQLFVGSFLGLVFLLATGSIIFFKMMTEAEEDKDKYGILRKIGVSKKEMKRTVRYQMGMIFMAPLLLGLLHGTVALIAFSNLLQMNLWVPILWWMLAYALVYTIYYFITVRGFYRTINQEGI